MATDTKVKEIKGTATFEAKTKRGKSRYDIKAAGDVVGSLYSPEALEAGTVITFEIG